MRRLAILMTAAIVALGLVAGWFLWPRPPALVSALRALPEVAKVECSVPPDASLTVIHVRDWHFVQVRRNRLRGQPGRR
jgi:hypothetical protein